MAAPAPPPEPTALPAPIDSVRDGVHAVIAGGPANWSVFVDAVSQLAVSLGVALLILVVTLWLSGLTARITRRALGRLRPAGTADATLQGFMSSLVRWTVIVIGLMAVLEQLGVRATSILALVGAASLAVGLALQGALSNVAAGVMILILRPYRVGDVVEINDKVGTVKRLDLFMTTLADADNLDVYMPNGKVFGEMIINYSTPQNRRMELSFSVDYDHDQDRAAEVLIACAKADPRILADPAPWANTTALTDHAVTITLRAWARLDVYWDARFDLLKRTSMALQSGGLEHPYPHQVALQKPPKPAA